MVCHFLHMRIVIEYSLVLEGIALCLNFSHNTKAQRDFQQSVNTKISILITQRDKEFSQEQIFHWLHVELSFSISKTS